MMNHNDTLQSRVLYIPDLARILNKTEVATRRAIERGQIPSRRWGRRVVVLETDLAAFLSTLPPREGVRDDHD